MKKILAFIFCVITLAGPAYADTVNINWIVDNQTYDTSTCNIGDDLILPTAPTKYGYTFQGWETYTPLEYIESTGTQYINTGIPVSSLNANIVTIETTFQMLTNGDIDWFGTSDASYGTIIYDVVPYGNTYIRWGTSGGRGLSFERPLGMTDTLHKLTLTGLGTLNIYIDDILAATGTVSGAKMSNPRPILIGRGRTSGSSRWANFKIQNGDTVVFHGIASRRNSDGAIGMFDRVSGTFFGNDGTGTFIAGPDL